MLGAIIGGTGFSRLEGDFVEQTLDTEYGSALVFIGQNTWSNFVFIPRHSSEHHLPPHAINYRANIKALHKLLYKK